MTDAQSIDRPQRVFRGSLLHNEAASPADARSASTPIFAERPIARLLLPLIALMFWALTHCYPGIIGDAGVYVGRVLADFDPNGVGRDMMFVHDGQSQFSLFPILLDRLVAAIGTERTGLLLAFVSMAGWTAALAYFAKQYGPRYFIPVVIIFVALLPVNYGAPMRFSFSEVLTVARPFSEALGHRRARRSCRAAHMAGVCVSRRLEPHPSADGAARMVRLRPGVEPRELALVRSLRRRRRSCSSPAPWPAFRFCIA